MNVFLCPVSRAALYPERSPEFHLSFVVVLKLYNTDTHSLLGRAYVLRPLREAASLKIGQNGKLDILQD